DDPLVTPSLGVQGVYVASEETYVKAREIGDRHDVRLHTHLSETRAEVEGHRNKTGLRPVEWLEKIGFLTDRVTAAHCVWVTMNEVRILARHGASVARGSRDRFDRGGQARRSRRRLLERRPHDSFLSGDRHQPPRLQLPGERCPSDDRRWPDPHGGWRRADGRRGGCRRAGPGDG